MESSLCIGEGQASEREKGEEGAKPCSIGD